MSGENKENKSNENKTNEKKTQQSQIMTYTPLPQKPGGYQLRRTLRRRVKNCTISGGKKKTRKRKRKRKRKMTRRKRRVKTKKRRRRKQRRTRKKKGGCWPFCKPKVADDISTPLLQDAEEKQQSDWASTLKHHKPDDLYADKDNYIYNNTTGEKTDKMWISDGKRYITGVTDKKTGKKFKRLRLFGQG